VVTVEFIFTVHWMMNKDIKKKTYLQDQEN